MKTSYNLSFIIYHLSFILLLASCGAKEYVATPIAESPAIMPDYRDVTMPLNIAAPTFALVDSLSLYDDVQAVFVAGDKKVIVEDDADHGICIDDADWKDLVAAAKGKITVTVQAKITSTQDSSPNTQHLSPNTPISFKPFNIYISNDTIDRYISYRLIEPGYEVWNKMGIYQRDVTSYIEQPILTNDASNGGCMNCHSYCNRDARTMSLHLRLECGGTYITKNGKTTRLQPKPSLVYPSWHPDGRYIAYSQNTTKQRFHTTDPNRIEVFDFNSDVVVYDTETGNTLTSDNLNSKLKFETFPSWSADGKTLYFCCADSVLIPDDYDKVHYSLCSIAFDDKTGTFGNKVDTLYSASANNCSVSFPRESPDGRFLMFTRARYGNFSIWHKSADLWLLPLSPNTHHPTPITPINSPDVESYHTWSSTGRWVVFSSRRDDGLYTRLYITHCSPDGTFTKPFELPQSDAHYYTRLMKSYNIPEFTINAFTDNEVLKAAISE